MTLTVTEDRLAEYLGGLISAYIILVRYLHNTNALNKKDISNIFDDLLSKMSDEEREQGEAKLYENIIRFLADKEAPDPHSIFRVIEGGLSESREKNSKPDQD